MPNDYYNRAWSDVRGILAKAAKFVTEFTSLETAFDSIQAVVKRSIKLPADVTTDQVITENSAARAGKFVGFDVSGNLSLLTSASAGNITFTNVSDGDVLTPTAVEFNQLAGATAGTVLTTGDEGSGNGLDADTLDGLHAIDFVRPISQNIFSAAQTIQTTAPEFRLVESDAGANEKIWRQYASGGSLFLATQTDTLSATVPFLTATRSGVTVASINLAATAVTINGSTAWHAGNDGAGSGLDADTLDGLQGSAFAQIDQANTFSLPQVFSGSPAGFGFNDDGASADEIVWYNLASAGAMTFQAANDAGTVFNTWMQVQRSGATPTSIDLTAATIRHNGAHVVQLSGGATTEYNNPGAATNNKRWRVGSSGADFGISALTDAGAAETALAFQNTGGSINAAILNCGGALAITAGSATINGNEILTTADEGSGNGLDADTLDGVQGSDYARLSLENIFTSGLMTVTVDGPPELTLENSAGGTNSKAWRFTMDASQGLDIRAVDDAGTSSTRAMLISRSGTTITSIAMSAAAVTINGNAVLTQADEGSGNGIDADTLDGVEGADYARISTTNTFTAQQRLEATTNVGWRFEDTDAATDAKEWSLDFAGGQFRVVPISDAGAAGVAALTMVRSGNTVASMTLNGGTTLTLTASTVTINGSRILTVADEGTGNGLDADTLDGLEGSAYARANLGTVQAGSSSSTTGSSNGVALGSVAAATAFATVAVGASSSASATEAVAIGSTAVISGTKGVGLGYNATSDDAYGVALGSFANTNRESEVALHVAQSAPDASVLNHGFLTWSGETTDATQTEIFLGGSASARATIAANTAMAFTGLIVGKQASTSANTAAYKVEGLIERDNAGSTTLVASSVTIIGEDVAGWDAVVQADDTNEALVVKVTGTAATNIQWLASFHFAEVYGY